MVLISSIKILICWICIDMILILKIWLVIMTNDWKSDSIEITFPKERETHVCLEKWQLPGILQEVLLQILWSQPKHWFGYQLVE